MISLAVKVRSHNVPVYYKQKGLLHLMTIRIVYNTDKWPHDFACYYKTPMTIKQGSELKEIVILYAHFQFPALLFI